MTELFLDGHRMTIAESTSIKLVDENSYFTKSGKYTFEIEVPLTFNKNKEIFGHINRIDVSKSVPNMKAYIIANGRKIINGTATITQITNEKLKIQILSGNAEINFLSKFQNLYIDEMDLGGVTDENGNLYNEGDLLLHLGKLTTAERYKAMYGLYGHSDYVFFPVHETNEDVVHNNVCSRYGGLFYDINFPRTIYDYIFVSYPYYEYGGFTGTLAVQPYWCFILKRIFQTLKYSVVENQIEETPLKNAFIANAKRTLLFNRVLPHWTLAEFINEVENFFGVIIINDDITKEIRIVRREKFFDQQKQYLDHIVDEFEVDVDDERAYDISDANISYSFNSIDGYLRVDEDIIAAIETKIFESFDALNAYYVSLSDNEKKKYIYEVGGKQYIDYKKNDSRYLKRVNHFRNLLRGENKDNIELKIMPVQMEIGQGILERIVNGHVVAQLNDIVRIKAEADPYDGNWDVQGFIEGDLQIKSGRDIIELAINNGEFVQIGESSGNTYPWCFVLSDDLRDGEKYTGFSLELNKVDGIVTMYDIVYGAAMKVNTQSELHIQFITDKIFDAMSLFVIRNKPYICKQIEYKINGVGIEPLKMGYFYEIL